MKRKKIKYSILLLCLIGAFLLLREKHPIPSQKDITTAGQSEVMVAPAIIDSLNDVTRVPTLQSGLIKKIYVKVGDRVKKGQILFTLENSSAKNMVLIQKITLEQAKNELAIQQKVLHHKERQLLRLQSLDKRAVAFAELQEKRYEVSIGKMRILQMNDKLELAQANLKNAELTLSQFDTVSPKAGIVLQINGHVNEFVGGAQPVVLLGDAKKVVVRISLDERDTQHFNPKAPTYLTSNENTSLNIPLTFMQADRYIVTQDRLNSRVQEVLYYFNRDDYPNLVAGQQFDANIIIRKAT